MIEQLSLWIVTIIIGLTLFFTFWYITFPAAALIIVMWNGIVNREGRKGRGASGFSKLTVASAAAFAGIIAIMLYMTLYVW